MESTPLSTKRSRKEVFTSPESDTDLKRHCSTAEQNVYSETSESAKMENRESDFSQNINVFITQLLEAFKSKEVMSTIAVAVSEAIKPITKQEISVLVDKNEQLKKDVSDLKAEVTEKDKIIESLSDKLDRSEQYSRRNNLRISGIPESAGENTDELVVDLAKSIGVELSLADIDISHRVPRYPPKPLQLSRSIIVRFVSNATKRSVLANRSRLKSVQQSNTARVFINEDLTRIRAELARQARALVKEKKVEASWISGGVILVKLLDGNLMKVANHSHMENVLEQTRLKMVISLSQKS